MINQQVLNSNYQLKAAGAFLQSRLFPRSETTRLCATVHRSTRRSANVQAGIRGDIIASSGEMLVKTVPVEREVPWNLSANPF